MFDASSAEDSLVGFNEEEYDYVHGQHLFEGRHRLAYYGLLENFPECFVVQARFDDTVQLILFGIRNQRVERLKTLSTYTRNQTGYVSNTSVLNEEFLSMRYMTVEDTYKARVSDSLFVISHGQVVEVAGKNLPGGMGFSWSLPFLSSLSRPVGKRVFKELRYHHPLRQDTYAFIKESFVENTGVKLKPADRLKLSFHFKNHPLLFIAEVDDSTNFRKYLISIDTVKRKPVVLMQIYQSPYKHDSIWRKTESAFKHNYIRVSNQASENRYESNDSLIMRQESIYFLSNSQLVKLSAGEFHPGADTVDSYFCTQNRQGFFIYTIGGVRYKLNTERSGKLRIKASEIKRFDVESGPCYADADEYFEEITIDLLGTKPYQHLHPPFRLGDMHCLFVEARYMSNTHDILLLRNAEGRLISAFEIGHHLSEHNCFSNRGFKLSVSEDSAVFAINEAWEFFYHEMHQSGNTEGVFVLKSDGSSGFRIEKTFSTE